MEVVERIKDATFDINIIGLYDAELDRKWKEEANKFKQDIKNGLKTEEQFKQWIEETRRKY